VKNMQQVAVRTVIKQVCGQNNYALTSFAVLCCPVLCCPLLSFAVRINPGFRNTFDLACC